jgi:sigma-E factor negative regulatory protein RseB
MIRAAIAWLALLQCSFVLAQPRDEAAALLDAAYQATRRLNYSGVFVYQNGSHTETARIVHRVDGSNIQERIEILDGSPREVVRVNDEVRCYMPSTMSVRVEKNVGDRPLLPILPGNLKGLADHYRIRTGSTDRVAGNECQVLMLEPKDAFRYGHKLWIDVASKMVLKAQTLDAAQVPIEGFTFTHIEIGGAIAPERLRPRYAAASREWRVEETNALAVPSANSAWTLNRPPPGFHRLAELKRRFRNATEVSQIVLSDGLSAVSVFIEPAEGRSVAPPLGASRQGAIHTFTRRIDNHLITVVGDAPAECVQTIANGVTFRGSQ